jgi:hypothetical protein
LTALRARVMTRFLMSRASRERGVKEMAVELRAIVDEADEGDRPAGELRAVSTSTPFSKR